jgi:hypothetical protein
MRSKTLAVVTAGVFLTLALASLSGAQQNCGCSYGVRSEVDQLPTGTIRIEYVFPDAGNNAVMWGGPYNSRLYIQVDGEPPELFASGQPGREVVRWFTGGHLYRFTLENVDGTILATDQLDLRGQIAM